MSDDPRVLTSADIAAIWAYVGVQLQRRPRSIDQVHLWTARAVTTGWEALTVTLPGPPQPTERWVVSRVTLHGMCAVNPTTAQSPIMGLFLVPRTAPVETLAEGQAGWNIESRGIPLPAGVVVNSTAVMNGAGAVAGYAYVISLTQSSPLIVSPDWTIRAVLACAPGTAQPGPGVNSWGVLTVMGMRELQAQVAP